MGDCYRNLYFNKHFPNERVEKSSNLSHHQITSGYYLDSSNYLTEVPHGLQSPLHSGSSTKTVKTYVYNKRENAELISEELNYSQSGGVDEFCTYGTARFVKSSTIQPIGVLSGINNAKKEQNLHVTFSDEYSQKHSADRTDCPIVETHVSSSSAAPIMATPFVGESNELKSVNNNAWSPITSIKNKQESSELSHQNVAKSYGQVHEEEKETNLMFVIKNLEETIKRMNEKLEYLKNRLSEDRNRNSANEDVEIEEFEETTTRMVPVSELHRQLESGKRHRFENALLEFDSLSHEMEADRTIEEYSSNGNIDIVENYSYRNGTSFSEWFSQYEQSYSEEQRSFIANLYETFQFDKTAFVKSIIGLLAKNVKSIGVQLDSIETNEKSVTTNQMSSHHVHCGDLNSINVSVVDRSTLKHFGVQSNPPMRNAFTCPIIFTTFSDKSSLTMKVDYHYCSLDIDYQISVKDESVQVFMATPIERQLKPNQRRFSEIIGINKRGKLLNLSREASKSPVANVNRYFSVNYENRLSSMKKSLGSTIEEDKSGKIDRLERVVSRNMNTQNRYLTIGSRGKRIGYCSRTATKSYRPYHRSTVFSSTGDNHLTQFNDFMRNTILQGYSIPVENNIGYNVRIDEPRTIFTVPAKDDDDDGEERLVNIQ